MDCSGFVFGRRTHLACEEGVHARMDCCHGPRKSKTKMSKNRLLVNAEYPIIVHSHLGWDWVWQRPQQFLSRLSLRHSILFVEGPVPDPAIENARYETRQIPEFPNVTVLRMAMPGAKWFEGSWVDDERRRLVKEVLTGPLGSRFEDPLQWFYDPMAVTAFAGKMNERCIVYDCMDQLSQFRGAPKELVEREQELLRVADVVFAGGPKIGVEKKRYHANTHVYGCGVDVKHFCRAQDEQVHLPTEVAHLPKPIYGFFGVIDERMDYHLLRRLADDNAGGSVVLVGPWTKIDSSDLPKRANLHFLGGRNYEDLPRYAAAFDVCLVPFALNEATEYVNPTKVLEYMATGRPVVSTPIEDIVLQFSNTVEIGWSHEEFCAQCKQAARYPDKDKIARSLDLASKNTWDVVVENLERDIDAFLTSGKPMRVSAG
jgi:glycosyltransferase involved in cell wall biosynthesis